MISGLPGGPTGGAQPPVRCFSIDVEDWYHFKIDAPETWNSHETRVHVGTDLLLEMLERRGVRATCFILAHVCETAPDLVRRIVAAGHEIASHGYNHQLIYRQTERQFDEDLKRSIGLIGDLAGKAPTGFRASSFSVSPKTPWFWDVLVRNGITWDSSVFPVKNPFYGGVSALPYPHRMPQHDLIEIPIAPAPVPGLGVPFSGGFYFRLHPMPFLRWGARALARQGRPVIYYVHPWEYDLAQPRMELPPHWRFFRYHRLAAMRPVTEAVLADGPFVTMGELAAQVPAA
ncbi:MAG TPA: polysaccharide deacetylase family protein [Candidatus Eisenbacteria bacterium]